MRQPTSSTLKPSFIDPSIVACLLCCTTWHEIALPLLYRDIVLRNENIASFTQRFLSQPPCDADRDVLKTVISLTVSLSAHALVDEREGVPLPHADDREFVVHELVLPLEKLPAALSRMTRLTTFSLTLNFHGWYNSDRGTICPILQSLPTTCVNLELELVHDNKWQGTRSNHVCAKIARCLPRLHHLRLRLGVLCTDILQQALSRVDFTKDEAQSCISTFPSLGTFIINCGFWLDISTCNDDERQTFKIYPKERERLVQALRELVLRGAFPNIERLWLVDGMLRFNFNRQDQGESTTWNRRDIARNITWAIPWTGYPCPASRWSRGDDKGPWGYGSSCRRTDVEGDHHWHQTSCGYIR